MSSKIIAINPDFNFQLVKVGQEQTPVIIIDDFALNLDNLIDDACNNVEFAQNDNSYYPGIRAKLPQEYAIESLQAIYRQLYTIYNIPKHLRLKPQDLFYSLITTAEKDLNLLQRLPHFDTSRPYYFAAIHYLNEGEHGGTGLFRHHQTGYERIDDSRVDHYLSSANHFVKKVAIPPAQYIKNSTAQFEMFEYIEYKANRLVLYPGNILHSAIVCPESDISACPKTGRLTANLFIEFK